MGLVIASAEKETFKLVVRHYQRALSLTEKCKESFTVETIDCKNYFWYPMFQARGGETVFFEVYPFYLDKHLIARPDKETMPRFC